MNSFFLSKMIDVFAKINTKKSFEDLLIFTIILTLTKNIGYAIYIYLKDEYEVIRNINDIRSFIINETPYSYMRFMSEEDIKEEINLYGIHYMEKNNIVIILKVQMANMKNDIETVNFFLIMLRDFINKLSQIKDKNSYYLELTSDPVTGIFSGGLRKDNNDFVKCFSYESSIEEKNYIKSLEHFRDSIYDASIFLCSNINNI